MVPHYMLVLLGWPTEPLFAILAPVWIVFCVYGYDVPLEARCVCSAILTILALIDLPSTVGFHVLLQFYLLPKASLASFTFEREVLGMNREDMPAKYKRIRSLKLTVPTLMYLFTFMGFAVLFELRRPVEAFFAYLAFVREVFRVDGYDVPFQVTRVGALVVAV